MTQLDVTGRPCLSFTVRSDWAHFRRIDTTTDKQTYRIIPRTTVAGLVAGILGLPRDSYYQLFSSESSAVAIEPQSPLRTMLVPMLTVPTAQGDLGPAEGISGQVVKPESMASERKRRSFEYLRNPAYRLHVVLTDEDVREELADRLGVERERDIVRPVYTPSLGKSECLAEIKDTSRTTVGSGETVDTVDSIVPESELRPTADITYSMERTPGYMRATENGRKTTEFVSYAFQTDGGSIDVSDVSAYGIGDSTVVFI